MTSKKQGPGKRAPSDKPTPGTPREKRPAARKPAPSLDSSDKDAPGAPFQVTELSEAPQERPLFAPKGLTPLEWRFAQEYQVDLNGTQAYMRASPEVSEGSARTCAARMLASANVGKEIQRLMDERAQKTGVTADRVFLKLWEMATADPRKLSEVRIGSCRHCWGLYNQYQYTETELQLAQDKHIREEAKRKKAEKDDFVPKEFHEKGGPGYDANRPPNPDCPECWGEGSRRAIIHDTRHLSAGEAALFDGIQIKRDKFGNETVNIKTQDRATYWQLVGRHLGMWNDKLKIGEDSENPLFALIREIQGAHATLPIVHNDPERRAPGAPPADVVDVQAKAKAPEVKKKSWRPA